MPAQVLKDERHCGIKAAFRSRLTRSWMTSRWFQLDERLKARLCAWPSAERFDGPILMRCSRPSVKCTITRQAKLVLAGEFCKTFNTMVCCGNDWFRSADFT